MIGAARSLAQAGTSYMVSFFPRPLDSKPYFPIFSLAPPYAYSFLHDIPSPALLASTHSVRLRSIEDASTWDMFGGGAMMDMMERSALSEAQRQADTARMLVMQAVSSLSPCMSEPGCVLSLCW